MLNEEEKEELTSPANEVEKKEETAPAAEITETVEDTEDQELAYRIETEDHEEDADLKLLNKEQLIEAIEKASREDDLREAARIAKEIRSLLDKIFTEEYESALAAFLEAGNEKDDFQMKPDELRTRFQEAYRRIQQRRTEARQRIEEEKLKNLEAKRRILTQLKELTETDETADSLEKAKELQTEWKKIRVVPMEFNQELWDSYRFYLDKFYDNLSINNELKDLDRKKNLETKIELCKKVDQLQEESSIKKAMNLLNKYHDEWKHTGPVPKEFNEEIWQRFKAASDKIYEQKKAQLDEIQEARGKNLELKTALVARLEQIATLLYEKPKEWIDHTQSIASLFEEWKKVGPVPKEHNESIWNQFKELRNHFYRQKNNFFRQLNKDKNDNLRLKTELCEKAEALQDSEDWTKSTNELIRLQGEWKKAGPVPEKVSDEIWKRFRAACDHFFARKEEHFKGQKNEQETNLQTKRGLIDRLKELQGSEEMEAVFKELKEIQKTWSQTGFVPMKFKNDLQKEYSELADALYKKFRRNADEMNEVRQKEHYEEIAALPDGQKKLQFEERRIREKIRFLRSDIETLENNIGFFSNSKTAGALIQGIKEKIEKTNQQIQKLEKELKLLKKMQ